MWTGGLGTLMTPELQVRIRVRAHSAQHVRPPQSTGRAQASHGTDDASTSWGSEITSALRVLGDSDPPSPSCFLSCIRPCIL